MRTGVAYTAGGMVAQAHGVNTEIGRLRTVLMHRPGVELARITPRHKDRLLFGSLPWLTRARQEHDILTQRLRDHGVEVLYVTELLQDVLEYEPARNEAICLALADAGLGDDLRGQLRSYLEDLSPEALASVLIAGLTPSELKAGRGMVYELLDRHDFVLDPLPNLVFTRDASLWIGDQLAVASLASEGRRREAHLASVIYGHHPRFAGTTWLYRPEFEHLDGGDVLLLAPGVIAVGVGERTTAAGAERLAKRAFEAELAHTMLVVPMSQHGGCGHLDTVCAVVDVDAVLMHPAVAYSLTARTITPRPDGMRVSRPQPFLEAAAQAMGIERLHVLDTGTEPVCGPHGEWEDGSNVLAVGRRVAISHERNSQTNARLEDAGIRVIPVPSSELGSVRGGPRCMACPITRDPARRESEGTDELRPSEPMLEPRREAVPLADPDRPLVPVPALAALSLARGHRAAARGLGRPASALPLPEAGSYAD